MTSRVGDDEKGGQRATREERGKKEVEGYAVAASEGSRDAECLPQPVVARDL
jgi:hypothetical protein